MHIIYVNWNRKQISREYILGTLCYVMEENDIQKDRFHVNVLKKFLGRLRCITSLCNRKTKRHPENNTDFT